MKLRLLQLVYQDSRRSLNHTFRLPSCPGCEHDENRMVRGQLLKPNLARLIRGSEFIKPNGIDKSVQTGFDIQLGDRHYLLERRDSVCDIFDVGRDVEFLSLVDVAVNSEQYFWFDLTK